MSRKAPPIGYDNEEIDSLLSRCQSTLDSWIIATYPHPISELALLETQLRESLPEAKEKAIFLMPLRLADGHVAGMIFKKTAKEEIKLFYFDPANADALLPAQEELHSLVQEVFPDKKVEFINVRFKVGDLGVEDSATVLVQSLVDVARILEKEELLNRSQFVSKAGIARFYNNPAAEILGTRCAHAALLSKEEEVGDSRKRKVTEDHGDHGEEGKKRKEPDGKPAKPKATRGKTMPHLTVDDSR